MSDYRLSEELGRVDTAFIEEVFEYSEARSERRHIMSKKFILRIAAAAACAAIVIGAGAAALWPRNGEN